MNTKSGVIIRGWGVDPETAVLSNGNPVTGETLEEEFLKLDLQSACLEAQDKMIDLMHLPNSKIREFIAFEHVGVNWNVLIVATRKDLYSS